MHNHPKSAARGAVDIFAVRGRVEHVPGADLPWAAVVRRCTDDAVIKVRCFSKKSDAYRFLDREMDLTDS